MITFAACLALNAMSLGWTLLAETTGFYGSQQQVAYLAGPATINEGYHPEWDQATLVEFVFQMKGNPAWAAPYSTDLSVLYTDSSVQTVSTPGTLTVGSGSSFTVYADIRTDYHDQLWDDAPFHGNAQRNGSWDSYNGCTISVGTP